MKLTDNLKEMNKIFNKISISDLIYRIEELEKCQDEFFKRCSPCTVGDKVVLIENINPDKNSGWYSSRHFLIKGSKAIVRSVEFYKDYFRIGVEFDDDSWLDFNQNIIKRDDKYTFIINSARLKKIN